MKKYDLHVHSQYSDGMNTIESMIKTALDRGIEKLAITDHMNAFGYFLYTLHKPIKSIDQYLREITRMRLKYSKQIEIYPGAEISEDFLYSKHPDALEDRLQDNLEFFSFFLIETIVVTDPVQTALNMRNYLDDQGLMSIPIILAHPNYSQMDFSTFELLLRNRIGMELNENKLSISQAEYFMDLVNSLPPQQKHELKLSYGSDAHGIEEVGSVKFVSTIIEQNQLWKYVISPSRVQDFMVS